MRRHILFGAYCVGVAVGTMPALVALFTHSRQNMSASHVLMIPLVAVALCARNRDAIFSAVRFSPGAGSGVIGLGAMLAVLAPRYQSGLGDSDWLSLNVLSIVLMWAGGFLLVYGRAAFRAALFPLCFLVFMIPIPTVLLAAAISALKAASAETVAALFSVTGTPYHRDGFIFMLPNVAIEIADNCSGIRSTIALLLTSLLTGHLLVQSWLNKTLLVLVILPITILKNGIRIVALSLLSIHVNPSFLTGRLHHEGGIVFFLLALCIFAPIVTVLCRREAIRRAAQRRSDIPVTR